jgi:TctA family transporter
MDSDVLQALVSGLAIMTDPVRLAYLFGGVLMGLALGILPGVGGVAGVAMLMPFTFGMDPATAIGILLGLASTTSQADPISAIVLGAPGGAVGAATALDGHPMTKRGEGGRALGAAYTSALMGGLFGAALMAIAIPLIRPLMMYIGSPELLALSVFGISMVAVLSGRTPLRGLTVACLGVMLAMIGTDPQTATMRWTLDWDYLFDGLPLVPMTLGIFALPELCDLAISRTAIFKGKVLDSSRSGLMQGARDCFRHWFLVLRCSWIGSVIGAIPGISAAIIEWISYGHALKTEKGAAQTFGKGDVRGVIAVESASNSREGGALVPTVVFGVPGSTGMALLLGAFLVHGMVPGPDMVTKNLHLTYSMVWSIAIANVLGSGLCFLFSGQFAKLATLRYTLFLPIVLCLIVMGAFESDRSWGDLHSLLLFGVLGWTMKHMKFPRPPLVLGFILGDLIERYMFISIERYGVSWMSRPVVVALIALTIFSVARPLWQDVRVHGGLRGMLAGFESPRFKPVHAFYAFLLAVLGVLCATALGWGWQAKVIPLTVGIAGFLLCALSLLNSVYRHHDPHANGGEHAKIHMDVESDVGELGTKTVLLRAAAFFGWLMCFVLSMACIGMIPTVPLFIVLYMRAEGREPWRITLSIALVMTLFMYGVFHRMMAIPWPGSFLGNVFPLLRDLMPSM